MLKTELRSQALPPIPAKRYFTIGEVSELCGVKPHVLRYWEQEFTQLKPVKRRGNRRYYQHHEVLLIRRIRELLYEQGFTISGARNRLDVRGEGKANGKAEDVSALPAVVEGDDAPAVWRTGHIGPVANGAANHETPAEPLSIAGMRAELLEIVALLRD